MKGGKSCSLAVLQPCRSIGSTRLMKEVDTWYQSGPMEASLVLFRGLSVLGILSDWVKPSVRDFSRTDP